MANEGLLYCIDVLPHCLASMFPCQHDTTAASCQNNVFIQIKMTGAETVVPLASQSERKTLTQIFFHKWQCLVSSFNGERQRRLCPFGALLASGCSPQGKNRRGLHTPSRAEARDEAHRVDHSDRGKREPLIITSFIMSGVPKLERGGTGLTTTT